MDVVALVVTFTSPKSCFWSEIYVEVIRNTPLLVQIYLLYFVFGPVIGLDRFSTAVLALSLFQGAYTAEIFRAGLNSIPKGQFEAAQTLGRF